MLTVSQLKALPIGSRVCFPNGAENYPTFHFGNERLTGTVSKQETYFTWIRLDIHKAELDEWQNEIQVSFEDSDINGEHAPFDIVPLLSVNDDSLDSFVRDYCEANDIECDGDAFGLVFSGADEFTEAEAIDIINEATRIYGLKRA